MRNIIDPICQGLKDKSGKNFILNGSKCKAVLEEVAANIKLEIHAECKNRLLSLKIDSATRLDRNIFGISAQFISKNEIKSRILCMVELKGAGSSASKNLAKEIVSVTKNTAIREYLFQCRNLTKYIRKPSNGYRDLFELRNFTLPQLDCPTRWGSTYNMIDQLNKAKSILSLIETVENNSQDEHIVVNELLWDFMDSYVTIMAPLQKTIVQFQQEQLHYGNFYALWLLCKLSTNQILTTSTSSKDSIIYTIGEMLIESMEARTKKLVSNVGFDACLYLDPRFQHVLDGSQKQRAINFLKTLWAQIKIHSPIQNLSLTNSKTSDTEHKESNLDLLDDFLSVVAIPPTQVTIERAFSSLKLVLSDNRNRLSHHTLENILLVRLNSTHFDSAIDNLNLFVDED
ncbi:PREDICTED: uncharacterized protein LOC108972800 [Bactrocera latifrons]|uniref:uncharacterized protein LOC108972800 n=1 Tax=Bactrocera latifrons TaxID=174628 RepID=UPI0008DD2790|nr:PREDICTED: uncharacterized protein LOC108972800 [Bactrocera latifrons]XP_018795160.1 PREDICTED: uncharacterized protein LOC108972800 [Bactrocera latifrons]XP_018795161.1 PREDICTED: uncharacterized protein LOC108972800 [Bactrocera latifrons]XP_018795162.1 PREDICTED: uncharacterized protein LOC108972800 [Bactrocera latifrons]XP_018795163.1 PREDICTED: uncharacterized protein LOC108972800 [Bactrocera latifrons]XP_018795164.1 PREDICTED: uncharacterized protein LOC108972800 [Bactrocera latifrons]